MAEEGFVATIWIKWIFIAGYLYNYYVCCLKDPGIILRNRNWADITKQAMAGNKNVFKKIPEKKKS